MQSSNERIIEFKIDSDFFSISWVLFVISLVLVNYWYSDVYVSLWNNGWDWAIHTSMLVSHAIVFILYIRWINKHRDMSIELTAYELLLKSPGSKSTSIRYDAIGEIEAERLTGYFTIRMKNNETMTINRYFKNGGTSIHDYLLTKGKGAIE